MSNREGNIMSVNINTPEDIKWLKTTVLKDVPLPSIFQDFKFAAVVGHEDAPRYVDLYQAQDPKYTDDFYRVTFDGDDPSIYCEGVMMNGRSNEPYTGTNTKF
jgi:hypothetical protein